MGVYGNANLSDRFDQKVPMICMFHILLQMCHEVWDTHWSELGLVSVSIHSGLEYNLVSVQMGLPTTLLVLLAANFQLLSI